ncbi:MAG: NAD(P)-dependent glycerol-3-phosphate dehydrogenase [Armatimonadetes bacterium]|nr:NAD(P)-dependent glycerol-3-phosphate dehydrogenase [Armatimonadota bacterium]
MNVAVIGAGSWGTALSILLARNGHQVNLHGRNREHLEMLASARENLRHLPGFALPEEIEIVFEAGALGAPDIWLLATPAAGIQAAAQMLPESGGNVVIVAKGLAVGTNQLLSDAVLEARPGAKVAALSGPNLALEIARGIPTAAVAASAHEELAEKVAWTFNCRTFRVYISDDIIGVELAGALKNVLAIGAGMSDGLGFGDNSKGALLARGLREMTLLGMALGGKLDTFLGIAGVGDLFATAASKLSRNYRVGLAVGQGRTLQQALGEIGQVAEGVPTAEAAMVLARRNGVQMPVFEGIGAVLQGRMKPLEAVTLLMERMPKREGGFGEARE